MKALTIPRHGVRGKAKVCGLAIAWGLGMQATAATIPISYSLAGAATGTPVATDTTLSFDSLSTVSVRSGSPNLNAVWNPVTATDHNVVDFTTGLNTATINWTFADGSKLFGTLLEDVSRVDETGTGPFTQTFTFTGGSGEFALATGSVSGAGVGTATGFTSSGIGIVNAPAIPEPSSVALLMSGLAYLLARCRCDRGSGARKLGP